MKEIYERLGLASDDDVTHHIVLDHEQRDKGRLKTETTEGEEVRIFLERGKPLLVGEKLKTLCGAVVQVEGAEEEVAYGECVNWQDFAKACYHLGNRHVKLQVGDRWLQFKPDHVLEEMVQGLGVTIEHRQSVFIPESGAYSHGHHH